jgi:hypothetical protein
MPRQSEGQLGPASSAWTGNTSGNNNPQATGVGEPQMTWGVEPPTRLIVKGLATSTTRGRMRLDPP